MMKRTNPSKSIHLEPEHLYELKFVGNANVVGGRVFFEVAIPNRETNDYSTGIYELRKGKAVRFTRGENDSGMVISRNGNVMAYKSKEDGKTAIYVREIETSNEYRIGEIEGKIIKMEWDSISQWLYVVVERGKRPEDFRVIENIPIYSDERGFLQDLSYDFIRMDTRGRSLKIISGKEEIRDFAINPMKNEIAVEIRPLDFDDYHAKVGIFFPDSGSIQYLKFSSGEYYRPGGMGGMSSMEYLDDGTLVFLLNRQERSIDEAPELVFWKDGNLNEVMKEHDISPGSSLSMDSSMISSKMMRTKGEYVYFVATVHGRAGIYRINPRGDLAPVVTGDFSVDSFDFNEDEIIFVAQTSNMLPELYRYDGKVSLLLSLNDEIRKWKFRRPENFHFKSSDGTDIEAWILRGRGKGTIVRIHGGPRGAFGESFVFEAHLLNSRGFNILYCNPRGSDSYGDEYAAEVVKRYGEKDYKDIMEMIDYSVKTFGLDPSRFGITGGSYGGFMVNWIVGHTNKFKAAVSDRSFADAISDYFSSDIGPSFDSDQIGGTPFDNIDTYWEKSPIKHIRNCKTPILLLQNESDYRCPVWQAYEFFTQLKLQGTVTKLVTFKEENHNLPYSGKPKNRVKRLEEIVEWFEKYVK